MSEANAVAVPAPEAFHPDPLRSAEYAADFLGTTYGTLAGWRSTRVVEIPFVKLGKAVRYRQSDLDAFVAANLR